MKNKIITLTSLIAVTSLSASSIGASGSAGLSPQITVAPNEVASANAETDIEISEIGFGAWAIALDWWGKKIEEDEAKRMLKKAYDVGINFFETGDLYGKGLSEKLIGDVFKDMRDEIVISTKYGYDFRDYDRGWSRGKKR